MTDMPQHSNQRVDEVAEALETLLSDETAEQFNEMDVPQAVRPLIRLARCLGVADDWARERRVAKLPTRTRVALKTCLVPYVDDLDAWLAGEESWGPKYSDAYVAFSAMRMAID